MNSELIQKFDMLTEEQQQVIFDNIEYFIDENKKIELRPGDIFHGYNVEDDYHVVIYIEKYIDADEYKYIFFDVSKTSDILYMSDNIYRDYGDIKGYIKKYKMVKTTDINIKKLIEVLTEYKNSMDDLRHESIKKAIEIINK